MSLLDHKRVLRTTVVQVLSNVHTPQSSMISKSNFVTHRREFYDNNCSDCVTSAFTSDDQRRVKGPRTRRRGREQDQPHRSLRTVPEEGEPNVGRTGGVEQRTTSGSKAGQKPQQFPTSRGLVTRPVRFA